MGYGHLRAAHNIASYSKSPILKVDRKPYTSAIDKFIWSSTQSIHTYASRDKESKSKFFYNWFENLMKIPEDGTSPSLGPSKFISAMQKLGSRE